MATTKELQAILDKSFQERIEAWQSAFDFKGITSKMTCCSLQLVFGIKIYAHSLITFQTHLVYT